MAAARGAARLALGVMVGTGLAAVVLAIAFNAMGAYLAITVRTVTCVLFHLELQVVWSSQSDRRVAYRQ